MADITNVFKATVKTIRVREKRLGAVSGIDKNILPPCRKPKTEFTTNAVEVVGEYISCYISVRLAVPVAISNQCRFLSRDWLLCVVRPSGDSKCCSTRQAY